MTDKIIKKRRIKLRNSDVYNTDGKLVDRFTQYVSVSDPDEYVRYYKFPQFDTSTLSLVEKSLLFDITRYVDYGNGIRLTQETRWKLAEDRGVGIDNINKVIKKLIHSGVLFRNGMSDYIVNPFVMSCGKEIDMEKVRGQFSIDKDGKWVFDNYLKRIKENKKDNIDKTINNILDNSKKNVR